MDSERGEIDSTEAVLFFQIDMRTGRHTKGLTYSSRRQRKRERGNFHLAKHRPLKVETGRIKRQIKMVGNNTGLECGIEDEFGCREMNNLEKMGRKLSQWMNMDLKMEKKEKRRRRRR